MAVGAKDYIDKLIVKKYGAAQVDNHQPINMEESIKQSDNFFRNANNYYCFQRGLINSKREGESKLQDICKQVMAKTAVSNSAYRNTQKERERLTAKR